MHANLLQHPIHGFFSVDPLPTEEELSVHYESVYFQNNTALNYQSSYSKAEVDFFLNENERLLLAISQVKSLEESRILEIGVGEGFLLDLMRKKNFNAVGLDYSSYGIKVHNPSVESFVSFGHVVTYLNDFSSKQEKFDVVIAKHIFEHVIDPTELTDLCYEVLKPEGVLAVQVPNDFNPVQNLALHSNFIDFQFWLSPPEHLHYFSRESLTSLLESNQFEIRDTFADFPIDWFLLNKHSNYVAERKKGKAAHQARVLIDGLISNYGPSQALDFYRTMSSLNLGRDFCIIATRR